MKNRVTSASEIEWETGFRRFLLGACLFLFLGSNLLFAVGLEWLLAFLEIDVYPFNPSEGLEIVCLILSYAITIASTLFRSAGFAVIGYSVLRLDGKRSVRLLLVALAGLLLSFGSVIGETFYEYGASAVTSNLSYFIPLWTANLILGVLSYLCLFFLCVLFRRAFRHRGNLRITAFSEPGKRSGNVLLTLYFWLTVLSFLFGLIPQILSTYSEVRSVGWPETGWDLLALVLPYLELVVLTVLSYFVFVLTGRVLTRKDEAIRKNAGNASGKSLR